jgi:hypothetical protein
MYTGYMVNRKRLVVGAVFAIGCLVIAFGAVMLYSATNGPKPIDIPASKGFEIPEYNSTISLAQKGRCYNVFEENYSSMGYDWTFIDLFLANDPFRSNSINRLLTLSAHDCNMTIVGYSATNENPLTGWLNYTVSGTGNQTLSFGGAFNSLNVIIDGTVKAQNNGWTLDTKYFDIIVTGAKSTVNIEYSVYMAVPA